MNKYTSIILSSRDANEYDRIYFFYTLEQGLARAVARGARKPAAKLAGHLEPGTMSEIYVARSRGMGQIVSAITICNFEVIKKDFEKLAKILKIFKFLMKNFSEGEEDKRIFKLLEELLKLAGRKNPVDNEDGKAIFFEAFWWKLFDFLGQKPEVARCVNCKNMLAAKTEKIFSARRGGVYCSICANKAKDAMPISDNQIKLLRIFLVNPLKAACKIKTKREENEGLERLRLNYTRYHFG